jgi:hypothetical protein
MNSKIVITGEARNNSTLELPVRELDPGGHLIQQVAVGGLMWADGADIDRKFDIGKDSISR